MGILDAFTALAAEVWRKYNTAGVPASGLHEPDLPEIETWGTDVEDALEFLAASLNLGTELTVTTGAATIPPKTSLVIINRASPATTVLTLPSVVNQAGVDLCIVDWSTAVTDHVISFVMAGSETIMRRTDFTIASNAAQNGSAKIRPKISLGGWFTSP